MIRYAVRAEQVARLRAAATPQAAGELEAVPWEVFNTQTYASTATTRLTFFQNAPATLFTGNMEAAGMFTAPNWFSIACFGLDVEDDATEAAAETGALDDIAKLILVGQPVWTLKLSGKNYGQFRLSTMHGTAFAAGQLATGTADTIQIGNVGPVGDGGWYWDNAVIIPPNVGWNITVEWAAAQTLVTAEVPLTMHIFGVLFRRVL
jgi:hypothetical protein